MKINRSVLGGGRAKDNGKNACSPKPAFKIGNSNIEFIHQWWPHLGHILIDTFDDRDDICIGVMLCVGQLTTYCISLVN